MSKDRAPSFVVSTFRVLLSRSLTLCPYSPISPRISRFICNTASPFSLLFHAPLPSSPRSSPPVFRRVPLLARWQTMHGSDIHTRGRARTYTRRCIYPGTYQTASLLALFSPLPLLVAPLLIANMPITVIYKRAREPRLGFSFQISAESPNRVRSCCILVHFVPRLFPNLCSSLHQYIPLTPLMTSDV